MIVDLCVIGGGDAGFSTALAGTALGLSVALIADGATDPPRSLDLILAVLRHEGDRMGARGPEPASRPAMTVLHDRLRVALAAAAPDRRFARLSALNVRVIQGQARFVDDRTVAAAETIRARRFVLASEAKPPARPAGLAPERVLDADRLVEMVAAPEHLLAFGGDPDTVALAQALRPFGTEVTLCLDPGGLLPGFDPELVEPVRDTMRRAGIAIRHDVALRHLSCTPAGLTVTPPDGPAFLASHVFAGGSDARAPADLGLDRAGIAVTSAGLVLSSALRTSNPRVYAVGALAGARSLQATQAQVAVVIKAAFFRMPVAYRLSAMPRCTQSDPQIAVVGLSEAEAPHGAEIWRWPHAETLAGQARGGAAGHVKVVANRRGRILGAAIVGPDAAEQIGLWALALQTGSTLQTLANVALPVPSLAEASRRIAIARTARRLQRPWLKRALGLLARFG